MVAAGLVIGGGAVLAAPLALTTVGFGSAGVIGGSIAAGIQASIGNVAAGSMFALCQSAGAAGISAGTSAIIGSVGAGLGSGLSFLGMRKKNKTNTKEEEDSNNNKAQPRSSNQKDEEGMVSTLQQVGLVCSYAVMLTLVSVAVVFLVNQYWSSPRPISDVIRDPKLRNQCWSAVQKIKNSLPPSPGLGGVGKSGPSSSLFHSPVAKSSANSPLLISPFTAQSTFIATVAMAAICHVVLRM